MSIPLLSFLLSITVSYLVYSDSVYLFDLYQLACFVLFICLLKAYSFYVFFLICLVLLLFADWQGGYSSSFFGCIIYLMDFLFSFLQFNKVFSFLASMDGRSLGFIVAFSIFGYYLEKKLSNYSNDLTNSTDTKIKDIDNKINQVSSNLQDYKNTNTLVFQDIKNQTDKIHLQVANLADRLNNNDRVR